MGHENAPIEATCVEQQRDILVRILVEQCRWSVQILLAVIELLAKIRLETHIRVDGAQQRVGQSQRTVKYLRLFQAQLVEETARQQGLLLLALWITARCLPLVLQKPVQGKRLEGGTRHPEIARKPLGRWHLVQQANRDQRQLQQLHHLGQQTIPGIAFLLTCPQSVQHLVALLPAELTMPLMLPLLGTKATLPGATDALELAVDQTP